MRHLFIGNNLGLTLCKQFKAGDTYQHIFITNKAIESSFVSNKTSEINSILPLYLYSHINNVQQTTHSTIERTPNLNTEIVNQIAKGIGLTFVPEKTTPPNGYPSEGGEFAPIDILDYIYAVLHSPTYREKYKEFLKIDFPRVPYPKDAGTFWQLVKLGSEIRQIHLLEAAVVEDYITQYPVDGNNEVVKPRFQITPLNLQHVDSPTGRVAAGRGGLHKRKTIFCQRTRSSMELLHRRLPACTKMVKRPQRPHFGI